MSWFCFVLLWRQTGTDGNNNTNLNIAEKELRQSTWLFFLCSLIHVV